MFGLCAPGLQPFSNLGMFDIPSGGDIRLCAAVGIGIVLRIAFRKDSLIDLHETSLPPPHVDYQRPKRTSTTPRRRTRDNADRTKQRATAGAWVPGPYGRGCATIVANDGRGIARNRPFGPVAAGGDGADSRPTRQTVGAYPRLNARAPIVPAPDVLRHRGAHRKRAPTVKRERKAKR